MSKRTIKELVPPLRFPEFQGASNWNFPQLGEISNRITKKVGDKKLTTVSITAKYGFVSQAEKFSRDISGNQYKNYIVLKSGDFSYNKGNSKTFPQGAVYRLKEFSEVAAPNAFISFRFKPDYVPDFYKGYFDNNYHGRQLLKFITSGARSDGLLNISPDDFFSVILPTPVDRVEQEKISDFLSSIDELIALHTKKYEALQSYKKGLIKKLFPVGGEFKPKLRFSEFKKTGNWIVTTIDEVASISSGGTPSRSKSSYWGGQIPWVSTTLIDFNQIENAREYITEAGLCNSSTKMFPEGTILMAMYGQGITRGKVAVLGIKAAINQACAAITLNKGMNIKFVFQNLAARYDEIRDISNQGGQENLSAALIKTIPFSYPDIESGEQKKIADCLSSVDKMIAGQAQKINQLKAHKKGLMQKIFPAIDEVGA